MKKLTALAFVVFGLPLWWWLFWKYYNPSGLNDLQPGVVASTLPWCRLYAWPFAALFIIWFVGDLIKDQMADDALSDQHPTDGVPHCRYEERGEEGFKATFKTTRPTWRAGLAILFFCIGSVQLAIVFYDRAPDLLPFLAINSWVAYSCWKGSAFWIEVTKNAVIIDGVRLDRKAFKHFLVRKADLNRPQLGEWFLGCVWGIRGYLCRYSRGLEELTEIASALNEELLSHPADMGEPPPGDRGKKRSSKY
jgi:hypothetical protein